MNKKIVFVTSNIINVKTFLSNIINELSKRNVVYIYTNLGKKKNFFNFKNKNIKLIHIPIQRNINLLCDLICFIKLFFLCLRIDLI